MVTAEMLRSNWSKFDRRADNQKLLWLYQMLGNVHEMETIVEIIALHNYYLWNKIWAFMLSSTIAGHGGSCIWGTSYWSIFRNQCAAPCRKNMLFW